MSDSHKQAGEGDTVGSVHESSETSKKSDPLALSRQIKQPGIAPVHLWNPPYCGEMDMRIARDGTWYHDGKPIRRKALVKLFSSVLKREGNRYYLVTPVEKVGIQVEDCPFKVRTVEILGSGPDQQVSFTLNTDEQVLVDDQHALRVEQLAGSDEPHPVVHVRSDLFALLSRSVYYQLVEVAETIPDRQKIKLGIWSAGHFFELGKIDH